MEARQLINSLNRALSNINTPEGQALQAMLRSAQWQLDCLPFGRVASIQDDDGDCRYRVNQNDAYETWDAFSPAMRRNFELRVTKSQSKSKIGKDRFLPFPADKQPS